MKKTFLILIFAVILISFSNAQEGENQTKINKRGDMLIVDFYHNFWLNVPDSVDSRAFSQGVNVAVTYNFPILSKGFSLAVGLGVKSHNFYSNSILKTDSATGVSYFSPSARNGKDYVVNKLSTTYITIPLEIRYKSKSKFRASLGFTVGLRIDGHTKYNGDDYLFGTNDKLKIKLRPVDNLNIWNFSTTARIGYKWINLLVSYSLNKIFTANKGPEIQPLSVGISIIPF